MSGSYSEPFEAVALHGLGSEATMSDPTGLLIIRAWIEEGSSEPLRAQIRLTTDISTGIQNTLTLARAEEVCATVQEWLARISSVAGQEDGAGEGAPAEALGRPVP